MDWILDETQLVVSATEDVSSGTINGCQFQCLVIHGYKLCFIFAFNRRILIISYFMPRSVPVFMAFSFLLSLAFINLAKASGHTKSCANAEARELNL